MSDNLAKSTVRATWVSGIAAIFSVGVAIVLAFLAVRQETATYYSNLQIKQIEYASSLLSELVVGELASGSLSSSNDPSVTERNAETLKRVIRAAEAVRIVSPPSIQLASDNVIDLSKKILTDWPRLGRYRGPQNGENSEGLAVSNLDADYKELGRIRVELESCLSRTVLGHAAVTEATAQSCDLHISTRNPRKAKLEQSNTPECQRRALCRRQISPDGTLPDKCGQEIFQSCGYPE